MNILYFPQLSMYDKQTGKFITEADGNLNMTRNFINEWHIHKPDDNFFVILPSQIDTRELKLKCKYFLYDNYVTSARINRFNFPMEELQKQLKHWKFDLLINDVPELSRNIIAMFDVLFGYVPKIMSNIHHMDSVEDIVTLPKYNYFLRVFDAIECSDIVTVLSESMKDMLYTSMARYLTTSTAIELMEKVKVFEPSVSYTEINSYRNNSSPSAIPYTNKIITFPGRLSIGEEKRTNWDKFQIAIQKVREKRQDFVVYFTDPNNADAFFDFSPPWVLSIKKDRNQFLNLLNKTDIIVSLMNIQGFGGIAIREALLFNCLPVIPYIDEYKKMNNVLYEGFIHGDITVQKLINRLNWALDNCEARSKTMYTNGLKFSIEHQMPELMKKLEVVLNG